MERFTLSTRSLTNMTGVHADLRAIVRRAIVLSPVDFKVTEGRRSQARQAELVRTGASRTLKSRHITGHAVDVAAIVGNEVRWDWPLYRLIADAMKAAAAEARIRIVWGGDWRTFKDGPHFELDRRDYPA